jgi:hypothetical protein
METHYSNCNNKLDKLQHRQQGTKQSKDYQEHHELYLRTINLTKINFTHEEWSLLNNGLKHSIEKHLDKYWTDNENRTSHKNAGTQNAKSVWDPISQKTETSKNIKQPPQRRRKTTNQYPKKYK